MQRRTFVLGGLASLVLPSPALAQRSTKVVRIGWLSAGSADIDSSLLVGLRQGLKELGYVEGKTFVLEERYTGGRPEKLSDAAADLIRVRPDVIVASGDQAALAAKKATSAVPIVVQVADALGTGLVANLARPGANVTGVSDLHAELVPKRLEILKELIPSLTRAAFLSNASNPTCVRQSKEIRSAAPSFGLTMISLDVSGAEEIEQAFSVMAKERSGGLIVCGDRMLSTYRSRIYEFAVKGRVPAMYANRRFVDSGGLMSYGTNLTDVYRGLAVYLDKILKGAKAGELPIEQPTKFEVAINLKAAKAIGLSVPRSLLLRADHLVE